MSFFPAKEQYHSYSEKVYKNGDYAFRNHKPTLFSDTQFIKCYFYFELANQPKYGKIWKCFVLLVIENLLTKFLILIFFSHRECQMLNKSVSVTIKSCIRYENQMSGIFSCQDGFMQGETLSPFYFHILNVNDFEKWIYEKIKLKLDISLY